MVIYEYTANALYSGFSFFLAFLAVLSVAGIIFFLPLLKIAIGAVKDFAHGEYDTNKPRKEAITQVIFVSAFTAILYGAFILCIVLCTGNAIASFNACVDPANPYSVSGEIQKLESKEIDYRGDFLGYGVCITVDGKEYQIELAPGLDPEALELLKSSAEVRLHYVVEDDANTIVKIEIPE